MCSILGSYNTKLSLEEMKELNYTLSHRGPDNSTVNQYDFKGKDLYLAHNRLSIQDLNILANQPMENERFVIVFNGEIYNHLEIRDIISFKDYKTHSDTETLLYCFSQLGIEKTLEKLIGMFSIALYDKYEEKLYLIRDRVGIKPLYYSFKDNELFFASELKGFPSYLKQEKNNKSLVQFVAFGYIPNSSSYYEDIHKLEPAHYLVFDSETVQKYSYWSLPKEKIDIGFDEAVEKTEELIRSSVKYRLLSDLEVGAFLSGGVDSSLVSTIMQQESANKIKTFSIGFEDKRYDESIYARDVAKHIGSEHFEYKFTPNDVTELFQDIDHYFDEPFGDPSALPTMILSKITKDKVTVALSGDGGDELFLGYYRYFFTDSYYKKLNKIPKCCRDVLSFILKNSGQDKLEKMSYPIKNLTPVNLYSILSSSIKPWELNNMFSDQFIYDNFGKKDITLLDLFETELEGDNLIDKLSRLDFNRYLPDDILTKVDRSSMAYSLEARVPLLDHRIVEFAYSLPTEVRLKYGPKSILKAILYKYIPKELIERPKQGFSVPLKYWFRKDLQNPLFDKIKGLDSRFNKDFMLELANKHIHKNRNFEYVLWNIMRIKNDSK